MAELRAWTYYQFDPLTSAYSVRYFRYGNGFADRLDTDARAWLSIDVRWLSRYIENGEVGHDDTSRDAIEAAVGFTLPD